MKRLPRTTKAERQKVEKLCCEQSDKEWQEYVEKATAEIRKGWSEEDYRRHCIQRCLEFSLMELKSTRRSTNRVRDGG